MNIQDAIDSGQKCVFVPKGTYNLTDTLRLRSDLVLFGEPGTVIAAAPGAFKAPEACLVAMDSVAGVAIHNITFRMRKTEYTEANGYPKSEFRHCLSVVGSKRVQLVNVRAESSGGDGLYIGPVNVPPGPGRVPCEDVSVYRSTFQKNHRQGISILALTVGMIDDCTFSSTQGTSPQAGIDIEPENSDWVNVRVRRCQSVGNRGPAFMVGMFKATPTTKPSTIVFEGCTATSVPADQLALRLGGVLNHEVPNGYLLPNLPLGTWIQWNDLIWRK